MKSTITKDVFTREITEDSKEPDQSAKSAKMKKGCSCALETEHRLEDKVEVTKGLSQRKKSGYETKATKQWKGVVRSHGKA